MKKILFAILLLSLNTNFIKAQSVEDVQRSGINVMKTGSYGKGIGLGESIAKLIEVLGQPDKMYDYYMEMDDVTAKVYQYNLNLFYFIDGKLVIYDLYDGRAAVGRVGGTSYKVGDKLTVTTKQVPIDPRVPGRTRTEITKSFLNFKLITTPGKGRNIPYETMVLSSIEGGDGTYQVMFDKNNTIINIYAKEF